MFKGKYHFLNSEDFNKLCERLLHNNSDYNIIKIRLDWMFISSSMVI